MSNVFLINEYDKSTRPLTVKLRNGQELKAEYFENYMTEQNLSLFDKQTEAAEEKGTLSDMHKSFAQHLSKALAKIEVHEAVDGGKARRMPDGSEAERMIILGRFSFNDLRLITNAISKDLSRPLEEDETTLSDGPAPKEELAPAPETAKDT
jgi:hypothetical protein